MCAGTRKDRRRTIREDQLTNSINQLNFMTCRLCVDNGLLFGPLAGITVGKKPERPLTDVRVCMTLVPLIVLLAFRVACYLC